MSGEARSPWPFTDAERAALDAAYRALTRVGNATRDDRHGRDTGFWDPVLDRAQQALGVVQGRLAADARRSAEPGGRERDELHPARPDGPPLTVEAVVRALGPTAAVWYAMGLVAYRVGDEVRLFSGDTMTGRQRVDADGRAVGPWEAIVHTLDDGFCGS